MHVFRSVALLLPAVVFSWGFSWYAITLQVGEVNPSVSVFWRFSISSVVLGIGLLAFRQRTTIPWRLHPTLAFMGATLFSLNFFVFYHATLSIPSGVVSVIFASATLMIAAFEFVLFRKIPSGRVILGSALGVIGLALMFSESMVGTQIFDPVGLAYALLGTALFSMGNIASSRLPKQMHLPSGIAVAMAYGAVLSGTLAVLMGHGLTIPVTTPYIAGLGYLSLVASVFGFVAYLTLVIEGGPARAGYVTVLFPIVALTTSAVAGEYSWSLLSGAGIVITFIGTAVVFARR